MKYYGIFSLLISVFFFSQPGLAATVYNRVPSGHSTHNTHSHPTAEVRKCDPPEELDGQVLNGNRSPGISLPGARRNIQFGKPCNIIYESRVSHLIFYAYITSSDHRHLQALAMIILFPFHAFW